MCITFVRPFIQFMSFIPRDEFAFAHHIMFLCREMHWKSYTMYLSQLPGLYVESCCCSLLLVLHYVYRFFALVHSWRASWKLSFGCRFFDSILLFLVFITCLVDEHSVLFHILTLYFFHWFQWRIISPIMMVIFLDESWTMKTSVETGKRDFDVFSSIEPWVRPIILFS